MAADHLHHHKTNGHQWAEVVVPKLAGPTGGGSEPSAENWRRSTRESRYHVDCPRMGEGRSEHPMEMEKSRISASPYRVDYRMMSSQPHQECRVPLAQTQQGL